MEQFIAKTGELVEKARKFAADKNRLREINVQLEKEVRELKLSLEEEVQKNRELNNKIKIIKLAQNIGSEKPEEKQEVTELKRKINEYIKEIDNCIAMLND